MKKKIILWLLLILSLMLIFVPVRVEASASETATVVRTSYDCGGADDCNGDYEYGVYVSGIATGTAAVMIEMSDVGWEETDWIRTTVVEVNPATGKIDDFQIGLYSISATMLFRVTAFNMDRSVRTIPLSYKDGWSSFLPLVHK